LKDTKQTRVFYKGANSVAMHIV